MKVKFEDRREEVIYFHSLLNSLGFTVTYQHAELVYDMNEKLREKGGKFDLKDYSTIKYKWSEKWEKYEKANRDGTK